MSVQTQIKEEVDHHDRQMSGDDEKELKNLVAFGAHKAESNESSD